MRCFFVLSAPAEPAVGGISREELGCQSERIALELRRPCSARISLVLDGEAVSGSTGPQDDGDKVVAFETALLLVGEERLLVLCLVRF